MSTDEKPTGTSSDDVKRKFREALEKKNAAARGGEAHLNGGSTVHAAQGAAGHKREFRRKSG